MLAGAALTALAASPAAATVLLDHTVAGTLFGTFGDNAARQNFLVEIDFNAPFQITGFGVYGLANPNIPVELRIRQDHRGTPDPTDLIVETSTVDQIIPAGSVTLNIATFPTIDLPAGVYWIGMSAIDPAGLGWSSYDGGGDPSPTYQFQMSGDDVTSRPGIYDLGYVIYGSTSGSPLPPPPPAIPEPQTWAMLICGLGLAGLALRCQGTRLLPGPPGELAAG